VAEVTVTVEAAFGSTMLDGSPTWTDISAYVRSGSITRGRTSIDGRFETGTASVKLDNPDGRFTPDNTSGAYYPDVKIGVPVRIVAEVGASTYPLFYGSVRSWPPVIPTGNVESTVTIPLADGFYNLNREDLAGESYAADSTDGRIGAVLDDISWPAGLRDLDTGIGSVQATDFAQPETGGEQPALAHLLDVAEAEAGALFMGPDGKVVFLNRVAQSGVTPSVTYDGVDDYSAIDFAYDDSVLFNDIRVAREDGAQVTYVNQTSVDAHGRRVLTRDVMPMGNDGEVLNVAEWLSALFGNQRLRITGLKFKPLKDTTLLEQVLGFDLRDSVTVQHDPPGGGTDLDVDCAIEQIRHSWSPGDWTTEWSVVPLTTIETQGYWILGTSELGTSTRLA